MAHTLPSDLMTSCDGFLYCLFKWAYDVTGGLFFTILLACFAVVIFISSQRFGTNRAFGFASLVGLLGSIFLVIAKLMDWTTASIFIIVGAIGFVVMIMNER